DGGLTEYIPLVGYSGVVKFGFYAHSTSTTNDSRFYIDNWRVIVAPDCAVRTGVTSSNVTFSTADLSWVGTGESFDIEYGVAGFTPSGTPNVSGVTTTNYTLGSGVGEELVSGTTYHYYVRQYCNTDDGYSSWVGPFVFSVPMLGEDCGAPIVIDALPYTVTDDTANYGDNPAIEGTPGASGCGSTSSYLNGNDVVYSYTADFDGSVKVSLTPTGNYAGIFAYDSCQNIGVNCIGGAVAGFSTNEIGFELPVEEGETYYLVISTWASPQTVGYTLEVEKILCPSPYGLGATDITEDSAVLEWSGSGVFDIEYGMTGFTPTQNPTNASTTGVTSPFTLTDLTPGTTYQYYVRQDCEVDDGFSDWVGPFTFTTLCTTLTPPTATQNFTGYTGAAPATLACWSEATGFLDNPLTGTTSSWMNQAYNYNYDTTGGANGTAAYINLYGTDNEWIISPPVDLGDGS